MLLSIFSRGWRRPVVLVLLAAALILGMPSVRATTVVRMTFSEVVGAADVITVGTVSSIEQIWDAEQAMPFTAVTFSDLEVLKGEVDSTELTLRFLGGPAPDGLTLVVAGMPQFAVRDRVCVVLDGEWHAGVSAGRLVAGTVSGRFRCRTRCVHDDGSCRPRCGGVRGLAGAAGGSVVDGGRSDGRRRADSRRVSDVDTDRSSMTVENAGSIDDLICR